MDRVLTRERLQGMWAGPPVPWTGDDRFAEDAYRRDVAKCCAGGVPGVYTGGSTGEFYAMDLDEFQTVTAATIEVCRESGTPVQIGCTSTYTGGAVRRARFAQRLGADAIQVALPFWFALSDDQVIGLLRRPGRRLPGSADRDLRPRRPREAELRRRPLPPHRRARADHRHQGRHLGGRRAAQGAGSERLDERVRRRDQPDHLCPARRERLLLVAGLHESPGSPCGSTSSVRAPTTIGRGRSTTTSTG